MIWHPNCKAYYPLEEASEPFLNPINPGVAPLDRNVGSLAAAGIFGQCRSFDGTDDYIDCGASNFIPVHTGEMSAFAWIYPTRLSSNQRVIMARWSNINQRAWLLRLDVTTGALSAFTNRLGTADDNKITTGPAVTLNQWSHVGFVYVPSTSVTIYLNGEARVIDTTSVKSSLYPQSGFTVGALYSGVTNANFAGRIDEPSVWTMAFQQHEVLRLMQTNQPPLRSV